MFGFPRESTFLVTVPTSDGRLFVELGRDDGQGSIHLSGGGTIARRTIFARGPTGDAAPYVRALTRSLPDRLAGPVRAYVGQALPEWLVAELRLHLADQVRAGALVLAAKRQPIAADTKWTAFDPSALSAWDFRLDNTAVPLVAAGDTYAEVTAFTPEQWRNLGKLKGHTFCAQEPASPPPEGWSLAAAAEALFPEQFDWCRRQDDQRAAFSRLSLDLLRVLRRDRRDLEISGYETATAGIGGPAITVPRELYEDDTAPADTFFRLDIWANTFTINLPAAAGGTRVIAGVKIRTAGPSGHSPSAAWPSNGSTWDPDNQKLLRADYRLRVERWKKDARETPGLSPPSPKEDTEWARQTYGGVPRSLMRAVRKELAPESWQRPGRRGGAIWREKSLKR